MRVRQLVFAAGLVGFSSIPCMGQTLSAVSRSRPTTPNRIEVFADGNVKSVIEDNDDVTTVTGALGIRYTTPKYLLTAQISVAATSDTIRDGWGATLLNPAVGKALRAGLLDLRYTGWKWQGFSPRGYASVSSSVWAVTPDSIEETKSTTALGLGLGVTRVLVEPDTSASTIVVVTADIGIAMRWLQGDIANEEFAGFKTATLGVDDEAWFGPELGFSIQVGDVVAGLTYYFFDTDIPGFSDGQIAAGISIKANILGNE